jgi:hypothetical protein
MSDGTDGWTGAKLGEQLSQNTDPDDLEESPSHWWIPFIDDPQVLRAMLIFAETYDRELMRERMEESREDQASVRLQDVPRRAEETKLFRRIFRTEAGMSIDRAIRQSDIDRQSSMIGLESSSDAGGTSRLLELIDRIETGYIQYMFGSMGTGKTDFGILQAELWSRMQPEGWSVASNIDSFERARTIERYANLEEWIQQDSENPQLFVWDEASSNASGYVQDASEVTDKFRLLLQSFRKNRSNLIIIGHTGKDVHPHIRRQANDVVEKTSKKEAVVWDEVVEGNGQNKQLELSGIEATRWDFDTREMSRWFWES